MLSLVGLRAVDVAEAVASNCYAEVGSYNKPIAALIPVVSDSDSLVDIFYCVSRKLGFDDLIIMKKPATNEELVQMYRELERELKK